MIKCIIFLLQIIIGCWKTFSNFKGICWQLFVEEKQYEIVDRICGPILLVLYQSYSFLFALNFYSEHFEHFCVAENTTENVESEVYLCV